MARDIFHSNVRVGLEKEGWRITADPLRIDLEETWLEIDMAAEQVFAAEKGGEKIAVAVKSFLGKSLISEFHLAIGQYLDYRSALNDSEPARTVFLAVPRAAFLHEVFQGRFIQKRLREEKSPPDRVRPDPKRHRKMDKTTRLRAILTETLEKYVAERGGQADGDDVQTQLLIDRERDQFQILRMGWRGDRQIFGVIFHFEIRDGKIRVDRNMSDYDIVGDLEEAGAAKSDIVLSFHAPMMRQFTGYAVA